MSYDLSIFQVDPVTGAYQQALFTNNSSGRRSSGTEYLMQRFLLKLLKDPNSSPYFKDGCGFMTLLNSNLQTEYDIFVAFSAALAEVEPLMLSEETTDMLDTEKFAGAAVSELEVREDAVYLKILVASVAGTGIVVELPMEIF